MLSLGKITAGPAAASYYTVQVAQGRDDYYSGAGEEPGRWIGAGAANLGWSGEVDPKQLASLLTGADVRTPPSDGAVAGFDLTFSAPKSVSVLWGVAGPETAAALRAGHDAAVEDALGYLEREACFGRRGQGGVRQMRNDGFVAAAFLHRTSRAGDPQLHTHVVVGNVGRGRDGKWGALDARHLYRQQKTAGFLYQARLRLELTDRLGLEWSEVHKGGADLSLVPREVVRHFSKRRAEVLEHMAAHGGRSAASAEIAVLETRHGKEYVPLARQHADWRARAAEHGLGERAIGRALERGRSVVPLPAPVPVRALTEHDSSFSRKDVVRALAEAQPAGATVADLEQLAGAVMNEPGIVPVWETVKPGGIHDPRYTTEELLEVERGLLTQARERRNTGAGSATTEPLGRSLAPEQDEMVRRLTRDGDGIAVVRAAAGTGKTYALDAAREAWQRSGIEVRGCALSARAALELSDQAGIESVTIAQLTHRLDRGYTLPPQSVLVIDEASMVGTRDLATLADATAAVDGKLVLVGDDHQLPEIQAGGAFRKLADDLDAIELAEVRRQREAWDRDALNELRSGDVERWARAYRDHGRITVAPDAEHARAAIVNDWARSPSDDAVMIASRRADVADLNQRAHEYRQSIGAVDLDELRVDDRGFAVGDHVIGTHNDRRTGILNGQCGTVEQVSHDRQSLDVRLDNGTRVEIGQTYLQPGHLDHGYALTAHRAQGMTVDSAYVLGGEDLYRELGYTALSRHRDESRFYVTRADVEHHDRDLPPTEDPEVHVITQMLSRSEQKDLAIDLIPEVDTAALRAQRDDLAERLSSSRPQREPDHVEQAELERHERAAASARGTEKTYEKYRRGGHWWERGHQRAMGGIARHAREDAARHEQALDQAQAERVARDRADEQWLHDHRREIERLLSVDQELAARDVVDQDVTERLASLDRELSDRLGHLDRDLIGQALDPHFRRDLDTREHDRLDIELDDPADLDPYPRRKQPPRERELPAPREMPDPGPDYFDYGL